MIVLGLTGSIGMGKSTTAEMFRSLDVPVYDSDAVVHQLYRGEAVPLIEAAFPGSVRHGEVDRQNLGKMVLGHPEALKKLEQIVHPLVIRAREQFLNEQKQRKTPFVVLDIPLLFETGAEDQVDYVVVVSAPEHLQRQRVLARANMDEARFAAILAKQMPDAEKRARADFIIETGSGLESARQQVKTLLHQIQTKI